jgi:tetratricopeptide (TPR) repeat protein
VNYLSDAKQIKKIQALKSKGSYEEGIRLCNEFIEKHPEAWVGYREKADILCRQGKYQEAMIERQKLAELNSEEPADYYDLAILALILGDNKNCVKWADTCLSWSKIHEYTYYYQASNFHKAVALKNLGCFTDALEVCGSLDDGYGSFISGEGFVVKEDLIKICKTNLDSANAKVRSWNFDDI